MKIKKTIIQIGASYGIILDKVILESCNLDLGDEVLVELEKVKNYKKLPKTKNLIKDIKKEVRK